MSILDDCAVQRAKAEAMPDEPPKIKKQTWRDWIPEGLPTPSDDELITRGDLMSLLREFTSRGFQEQISERTLQLWEALGILPGPVRKFHQGATRALYPPWYLPLVIGASVYANSRIPSAERAQYVREMLPDAIRSHMIDQSLIMREQFPALLSELADLYESLGDDRPAVAELEVRQADGTKTYRRIFPIATQDS